MAKTLRVYASRLDPAAARKHLSTRQRKQLQRKGHLDLNAPENRQQGMRMQKELGGRYVS